MLHVCSIVGERNKIIECPFTCVDKYGEETKIESFIGWAFLLLLEHIMGSIHIVTLTFVVCLDMVSYYPLFGAIYGFQQFWQRGIPNHLKLLRLELSVK
jgi:hypothetical protein